MLGLLVAVSAVPAMADGFKCGNDTDLPNARWHVRVNVTTEANAGRKIGFLLLHNAHEKGAIVRTDDRRRLQVDDAGLPGVTTSVKLNAKERKALRALADQRLNLKGAARVSLWLNAELNEKLSDTNGSLTVSDEDGEEVYSTALDCEYAP